MTTISNFMSIVRAFGVSLVIVPVLSLMSVTALSLMLVKGWCAAHPICLSQTDGCGDPNAASLRSGPNAERAGPQTSPAAVLSRRYRSKASAPCPGRGHAHYEASAAG